MGTIQDVQNAKYRSIVDLIKNEEPYDKNQRVISGLELFYLCYKRYQLLQEILEPIKNILGKDVVIMSVNFNDVMQDEIALTIKYSVDGKLNMLVINAYDFDISEIGLSDKLIDSDAFLETNREIIFQVLHQLDDYEFVDEHGLSLKSSSKKFIASDNINDFTIRSSDEKMFSVGTNYLSYDKDKKLYIPDKITSESDKLKEALMDEEIVQKIYGNLRIYEENLPKRLIKKIT